MSSDSTLPLTGKARSAGPLPSRFFKRDLWAIPAVGLVFWLARWLGYHVVHQGWTLPETPSLSAFLISILGAVLVAFGIAFFQFGRDSRGGVSVRGALIATLVMGSVLLLPFGLLVGGQAPYLAATSLLDLVTILGCSFMLRSLRRQ